MSPNNKNKNPPRGPRKSRQSRSTTTGQTALQRVYKFSKDQVTRAVRNRYGGKSGMSKMTQDLSLLMSVVNTEDKHIDYQPAAFTVSSTATVVNAINVPAQGTTNVTRIGDSIKVNRFDLNLQFQYSAGVLATSTHLVQHFRWWLIRYLKTPSSSGLTAFSIGDFLLVDGNAQTTCNSLPNTDLNEDFAILCQGDAHLRVPAINTSGVSDDLAIQEVSHECGFHQAYNGAAAANIVDNMVFFVCVASNPLNAGGTSFCLPSIRMWYIDN